MSEPYIRAYMADMRADPKLYRMNADMRLALLHAYDLAKNGPGDVCELRASDGRTMSERALRTLANVSGASTRRMFQRWSQVGLCEIEEEDGEMLVVFPNLAKRQGIDRTNAQRQKRFRERHKRNARNGESNGESNGPKLRGVTGENQNQNTRKNSLAVARESSSPKPSQKPRQPDPIWDALLEACPAGSDMTKSERGRRNAAAKELREINADPADVRLVARRLREKWGGRVALTPSAIVTNWSAALAEIRPNGAGRTWTREDADQAAAERAEVEEQQRQRAAAAAESEEIPY